LPPRRCQGFGGWYSTLDQLLASELDMLVDLLPQLGVEPVAVGRGADAGEQSAKHDQDPRSVRPQAFLRIDRSRPPGRYRGGDRRDGHQPDASAEHQGHV
jgi:hypothetical protein